uniref:uncharacterized protein n=3 Tax=Myxine glutinosa TaxID=7769 RepID=UPI00358DDE08
MFLKEAHLLSSLSHPNIVKVLGVKQYEDHCFMVTEFVLADTLSSMLRAQVKFSEELLKPIIRQAASAFDYMHNMNVAHGDIKLANLLYSEAAVLKVVDFGTATTFERGKLIRYRGGTISYMSPEMVQRKNYYGPAADVWALGVTLHTLLNREYPFKKDELKELQNTGHLNYKPPPRIEQSCTSLLKCMFSDDPSLRFSMEDILHHPWTTGHSETTVQELTDKDDEIQEDKEDVSLSSSPEELERKRMKGNGEQKLEKQEEIKIDDDSQSVRLSVAEGKKKNLFTCIRHFLQRCCKPSCLKRQDDEIQEDKEDVSLSSSPEELERKRMKGNGEQKLEKQEEIKIDDDSQSVRLSVAEGKKKNSFTCIRHFLQRCCKPSCLKRQDDEIQEDKEDVSLSSSPEELERKRMKGNGEQKLEKQEEIKIDDDSQSVRLSVILNNGQALLV